MYRRTKIDPTAIGQPIGRAAEPRAGQLWCRWDRTTGVIGPQGSGKTLDLLTPALLAAPGAALTTLTKTEDLLLSITARGSGGRATPVLDPFSQADGVPELLWDPVQGGADPMVAERRGRAFTAGTIKTSGQDDGAARFYAAEAGKVLQCYFHAAALAGYRLDRLIGWAKAPLATHEPAEILLNHPAAAPAWHGLLQGALTGDHRTASNTITTVQQALSLFFQPQILRRCVPGPGRPATDIAQVIRDRGTFYLLGREDPYASASPLMTALTEHILDTALTIANDSSYGKLCPPMLACLDELPSTAPLPSLQTRAANERALGISFIYAAQTWAQLTSTFGLAEARSLLGLTNVLIVFGGSKDIEFNRELSDLVGTTRINRTTWQQGGSGGRSSHGEDMVILRPEEIRRLPARHALVLAENGKPILAKLSRCIDGKAGQVLLQQQRQARHNLQRHRTAVVDPEARAIAAQAGRDTP